LFDTKSQPRRRWRPPGAPLAPGFTVSAARARRLPQVFNWTKESGFAANLYKATTAATGADESAH